MLLLFRFINLSVDGYVNYVTAGEAQSLGLIKNQGSQVYMGVDTWSHLDPNGPGRKSTRIQSKTAYTHGLIIADFAHIPGNSCGSWPAFWMVGPNWPNQGELDIVSILLPANLQSSTKYFEDLMLTCRPGFTD